MTQEERDNELTLYTKDLSRVEGAEALASIASREIRQDGRKYGCKNKDEIRSVYYILTMVLPDYKDAYCYAMTTTTHKSKHEQKIKFAKYIETLNPRHPGMDDEELSDQERELYSLAPLIPNGSNIQRIKDRFREATRTNRRVNKISYP